MQQVRKGDGQERRSRCLIRRERFMCGAYTDRGISHIYEYSFSSFPSIILFVFHIPYFKYDNFVK